jgi:hypothetical protein
VAALAGGAAALTAFAGVGVGASRSLPGDAFYGVKRATEHVQLATSFGRQAKGERHLQFARTRLSEVRALVGRSDALAGFVPGTLGALGPLTTEAKVSTILATLREMDAETRAGADDLYAAYTDGADGALRTLDSFTQQQFRDLRDVLPALPDQARPRAQASLALLNVVATKTVAVAGETTPRVRHRHHHGSGQPHPSATPHAGHHGGKSDRPGHGGNGTEPTPTGSSKPHIVPTAPPKVPKIPTLPPVVPLPTEVPTSIPTLKLPSLHDLG